MCKNATSMGHSRVVERRLGGLALKNEAKYVSFVEENRMGRGVFMCKHVSLT